jgi:hypothetical protein
MKSAASRPAIFKRSYTARSLFLKNHNMRHRKPCSPLCCLALGLAVYIAPFAKSQVVFEGGEGPGKGKHVVLLAGDHEYRSEETIPALARILAKRQGFKCSVVFSVDEKTGEIDPGSNHMPGIKVLDTADLAVIFLRFRNLPVEQMKYVVAYMERGGAVMGLRTSTHAFQIKAHSPFAKYSWDYKGADYMEGWGQQVLGQSWVGHYGRNHHQSTRIMAVEDKSAHPILCGVKDIWVQAGGYVGKPVDGTILTMAQPLDGMTQDAPANAKQVPMPSEWIRSYKGASGKDGRVFTSLYGASEDLLNPGYRRMLVNAVLWSTGLEAAIKPDLAVDFVGPYMPNTFSDGGHFSGVKPAVYAGFESPIPAGKAESRAKGKRNAEAAVKPTAEGKPAAAHAASTSKRPQVVDSPAKGERIVLVSSVAHKNQSAKCDLPNGEKEDANLTISSLKPNHPCRPSMGFKNKP